MLHPPDPSRVRLCRIQEVKCQTAVFEQLELTAKHSFNKLRNKFRCQTILSIVNADSLLLGSRLSERVDAPARWAAATKPAAG